MVVSFLGHCLGTYHLLVLTLEVRHGVVYYVTGTGQPIVRVMNSRCQMRGRVVILCSAAAVESFLSFVTASVHEVEGLPAIDLLTNLAYAIVLNLRQG